MISKILKTSAASLLLASAFGAYAQEYNGYIVKFKEGASLTQSRSLGNISKITETPMGTFAKLDSVADLHDKSFQSLQNHPDIEYIEPNYIITVENNFENSLAQITDGKFSEQWGLANDGKGGGVFSPNLKGEDINALKAWEITKGNREIKVAVIDTGVEYNHPDLKDQMDVNLAELNGQPGVDDDGNGYVDDIYGYDFANNDGDPQDGNGHGTHCAGVIGARHNTIGIAGVMANVRIVGVKFLSDKGSGETIDAINAIMYAIKRDVHVMSNSWGGGGKGQALQEAIEAANDAGIIFIAAAGNESSNNDKRPTYPANYEVPNVVSVGSFTGAGKRSSFSNYGETTVHVTAPGTNILSTFKGSYSKLSGTSMATPFVSGIVGLMLSEDSSLSPAEIKDRLIRTSNKTSRLTTSSVSGGRVDAYRAVTNK